MNFNDRVFVVLHPIPPLNPVNLFGREKLSTVNFFITVPAAIAVPTYLCFCVDI